MSIQLLAMQGDFATAPGFVDSLTYRACARKRMLTMPSAYGAEYRQDVIGPGRKGEAAPGAACRDFGLFVTT